MNRKTLAALGAFAVLVIVAVVALRQPEKGERASDRARPIPALDAAQITSIDVTKGGTTTSIKRDGANFRVTAPVNYPADPTFGRTAFESLGKMDVSDLVSEQPEKQAEFEVDDKTGVRVVAKHDGTVLADIVIGKAVGAGTMVRQPGKNDIWEASGVTKYMFDKTTTDWRDKSITTFPAAEAEKLDVASKDGQKISLKKTGTKQGNDDKWDVTQSSVKIDNLDNSVPNGVISALASWKANDFADDAKPADTGLDAPALTVSVGLKDGKTVTALVGNKKGTDDWYVKKADAPQVFLVKKFNLERINKRPIDFRDKTLCDLAAADLTEISVSNADKSYTLVKNGNDWKATKPPKLEVDSSKVVPIAGAFKDWKATSFAEDQSLKNNGLGKPRVISVKTKSKTSAPACQIRVGDETADKVSYFAASAKAADVYLVPKWSVDRILVKPDDLKKGATTAAAPPAPGGPGRRPMPGMAGMPSPPKR
ncbi:MAG TPA: DUF4340 domain-containing protein [Polyangia bacterium]|nr:DUF4340 domain-containing protein [Polyangia bacterium]